ncbi:MAG: hypothetical protein K2I72_02510 [Bacilli bacterium]|nr:hypothetical protein [Bacilli bacterium]
MNIKNVYVGRYKSNNRETVFCQRSDTQYEDLQKEGKKVSVEEIRLDSLIPYEDAFQTGKKEQMKNDIVRLYREDRKKVIDLSRVYIGDIYKVTEIIDREFTNHRNQSLLGSDCHTTLKAAMVRKGALLLNFPKLLKDMEHSIKIKHNNYPEVGEFIVIENDLITIMPSPKSFTERIKPFTSLVPMKEEKAPKRKILQKYQEYKDE